MVEENLSGIGWQWSWVRFVWASRGSGDWVRAGGGEGQTVGTGSSVRGWV